MRAFFSLRLSNLARARNSNDDPSSTHRSSTLFAPGSNNSGSLIETDSRWTAYNPYGMTDSSSEASPQHRRDHARTDAANQSNTPEFIKVHYGTFSALTFRSELFEDLEQAARKLCILTEDIPVFISADLSALKGRRIRIDQRAWGIVYKEIFEVWLTILSHESSSSRSISLEPIDDKVNDGQAVSLKIGESGTIGDIRQAFVQRFPQYDPQKLLIWSCDERCEVAGELSDKEKAKNACYRISPLLTVEFVEIPFFSDSSTTHDISMGIKREFGTVNFRIPKVGTKMTSEIVAGMGARTRIKFSASHLLVMHYGDSAILTASTERYEDIEETSRRSFFINQDTHVFVTARLSPSDETPTTIDSRIWAAICSRISEIWIMTNTHKSKGRIVALKHLTSRLCVAVKVEEESTVADIKGALSRKFPGTLVTNIGLHGAKSILTNESQHVTEEVYRFSATCSKCESTQPDEDHVCVNLLQRWRPLGREAKSIGPGASLSGAGGSVGSLKDEDKTRSRHSLTTGVDTLNMTSTENKSGPPLIALTGSSGKPKDSEQLYSCRAKALYNYTASADDPNELSFQKGELLDIVDNSGKWWQAKKADGTTGIAPSNYLVIV